MINWSYYQTTKLQLWVLLILQLELHSTKSNWNHNLSKGARSSTLCAGTYGRTPNQILGLIEYN